MIRSRIRECRRRRVLIIRRGSPDSEGNHRLNRGLESWKVISKSWFPLVQIGIWMCFPMGKRIFKRSVLVRQACQRKIKMVLSPITLWSRARTLKPLLALLLVITTIYHQMRTLPEALPRQRITPSPSKRAQVPRRTWASSQSSVSRSKPSLTRMSAQITQ